MPTSYERKKYFWGWKKYFGMKNSIFHFVSIEVYTKWSLKKKSILRHFAQNHKYLQLEKSTKYCKKGTVGIIPRKVPHQDHYKPVKPLVRTNTYTVGNCPGGKLVRIRSGTIVNDSTGWKDAYLSRGLRLLLLSLYCCSLLWLWWKPYSLSSRS